MRPDKLAITTFTLIVMLASSLLACPIHSVYAARSNSSNYSIDIDSANGQVAVTLRVDVNQNLTGFITDFQLPVSKFVLQGSNASLAQTVFQQALQAKNQDLTISDLKLEANLGPYVDFVPGQWFNVTASFIVHGVTQQASGGAVVVNLNWKDFAVQLGVFAQSVEINRIGESYLYNAFQTWVEKQREVQGSSTRHISFEVDGDSVQSDGVLNASRSFTVFDFSKLSTPLDSWPQRFDFSSLSTVWSKSESSTVTALLTIVEETTSTLPYSVRSSVSAEVAVKGVANASGDSIRTDTSSSVSSMVMFSIIAIAVSVLVGSTLYIRRLERSSPGKVKKGK